MKYIYAILFSLVLFQSFGQLDFTPHPGTDTHCPGELKVYTGSGWNSCQNLTWTITHGKIRHPVTLAEVTSLTGFSEVTIKWDDVPNTGKLRFTATCDGESVFVEKSFEIRSLTGRIPANIRKNPNLNFCETTSVRVFVDVMFLENTGGFTNIQPQQRADGYEWVLPTGWTHNGSATTPVRTVEEFIDITPIDGCKGGSITVKAFKNCTSGRKYSASSPALSLNRPIGPNLQKPASYTGPKCGDTNPVVFTATNIPCATNYRWTATNTQWKDAQGALGPWNTATNTITLFPSGTPSDQGVIAADIVLSCATLTQTFNAIYSDPPLSSPIFTSGSSGLLCSNATGTVSINSVSQANTYNWYGPSNVLINNVATSPTNPVVTTTTSVTITAPTLALNANGFAAFIHVTASRPNLNCAGSPSSSHKVWIGRPAAVNRIMLGHLEPIFELCTSTIYQFDAIDPFNPINNTSYYWFKPENSTIMSGQGTKTFRVKTGNLPMANAWLSVRADNTCGNSDIVNAQLIINNCSGGGRRLSIVAYPNPTSEELTVSISENETNQDEYSLIIFNEQQEKVESLKIKGKKALINVRGYKKGVYFLKVVDKKRNDTEQLRIYINN